jgi:hypothetical protein
MEEIKNKVLIGRSGGESVTAVESGRRISVKRKSSASTRPSSAQISNPQAGRSLRSAAETLNFRLNDYLACNTVVITPEMRDALDRPRFEYTELHFALILRICNRIKSFGAREIFKSISNSLIFNFSVLQHELFFIFWFWKLEI